ncbi:MAG: AAA family ATPase, partial [Lachnospiraceae bacterium]|nr:AAA family ATPase [Lachnospiraceae bacterium]
MESNKAVAETIEGAFRYAVENHLEYVTPEIVLLSLCDAEDFAEALADFGIEASELKAMLADYAEDNIERIDSGDPEMSGGTSEMLYNAALMAANSGRDKVDITHIIHAMFHLKESHAVYYLKTLGIDETELLEALISGQDQERDEETDHQDREEAEEELPAAWKDSYLCINDIADSFNPLIGREDELERTIQVLCRRDKNNPLYIGEPGVGKTALVYGLAQRINEGRVPEYLSESRIYELDLGSMLAGTQYRGDFEKKLKKVLKRIGREKQPIIFIDEIHNLSGAGAVGESSFDASNMLKPYLIDDHIRFIGATTYDEYKKRFERNRGVIRRFQKIEINEPSGEEAVAILEGLKKKYESYHGVSYADGVMQYAVAMSAKYINERFLPDKAIDLIDEAGAYMKLKPVTDGMRVVDKDVVSGVLTRICRVPVETVSTDENEGLETLELRIRKKVFGQDEAVSHAVNAIKFSRAGLLEKDKPLASLLFVGPTGVGKTEVAKSLADEMGIKLVRFDMSEYEEKHAVAKLIGAPAGYVGYEEGGLLTESIRKNPYCVLLLDEIEKAHADIYNILLSIMDYATLTDNQGRKADFRNVIVIMTSNAGAGRIGKQAIGFLGGSMDKSVVMEEVKRTFQPEFRNRLNRIVVFNGMDDAMADRIVRKKLNETGDLLKAKGIAFSFDDAAAKLIKKRGISTEYGAR